MICGVSQLIKNEKTLPKLLYLITEEDYFWSHRSALALAAKEKGYDVYIATKLNDHGVRLQQAGLHPVSLPWNRGSLNPLTEIKTLWLIFKTYHRIKPDVVHHVALKPVLYGSIMALCLGIQKIVNALGGLGYIFTEPKGFIRLLSLLMAAALRMIFVSHKCHLIVQNTEDEDYFKRFTNHVVRIPGAGIDPRSCYPAAETPKGSYKIIMVSRALLQKGVQEFIQAARIVISAHPDVQFLFAGKPDPGNPTSVGIYDLQNWHHEGVITWLGHVEKVPELYRQCHMAVLPSYREGLPKSLLEALCCGLPIVATDVPGCRELVLDDHHRGILVPKGNAVALADAIIRVMSDNGFKAPMHHQGLEAYYSDNVIDKTLALYE